MTLDDCKRIHHDMWNYIAGAEDRTHHSLSRSYLKDDFCARNHLLFSNNCALCEYALDQYNAHHDECVAFSVSHDVCTFCPALWGTEGDQYGYYCEHEVDGSAERIDWRYSKADDIRDIKWKDEVE